LYLAILLNISTRLKNILGNCLWYSKYMIILSAMRNNLDSSFLLHSSFISFSYLIALFSWSSIEFCQLFFYLLRWSCSFVPDSIYMSYYIHWAEYVEIIWHSWNEKILVMIGDVLIVLLNFACSYFIKNILHLCSLWILFCSFCCILFCFLMKAILNS
jgi:hypothetical protein